MFKFLSNLPIKRIISTAYKALRTLAVVCTVVADFIRDNVEVEDLDIPQPV